MDQISIFLMGRFQLTLNGASVTGIESDRGRALLAYLALETDHPHSREALAGLLWPDVPERAARQNLRQALYNLRRALDAPQPDGARRSDHQAGVPDLLVTPRDVQFNPASDYWLDVKAFTALLDAPQSHAHRRLDACGDCMGRLARAVELYQGDFLAGFSLPDNDPFEEWRLFTGERLHRQVMEALSHLASYHERRHEYETATCYLGRQLELEPWREEAHQQLMEVLALSGARSAALQQYESCRRILAEELGAEPSAETRALHERIKTGAVRPELVEVDNPYRGLHAFTEADAGDFFGREAFVERLVTAVCQGPVVAVVGASGSGKSSVVRAGLLPRLRSGPFPAATLQGEGVEPERDVRWLIADFRPGNDPFRALADALIPLIEPRSNADARALQAQVHSTAQRLREGELPLVDVVDRITRQAQRSHPYDSRVLLIIDHFEDLYTLCPDLAMRRAFLDLLLQPLASITAYPQNLVLLLSLRADFVGQALSHRALADALQMGGLILGPMNRTELRRAIEEPARGRGVIFEPGLVGRLLDDAGDDPGNLPLLQFALTLLWERQVDGGLSHTAYEEIGGVAGALTSYADDVYEELSPAEQEGARRIFLQMVHPGEGTEDTRRLAAWDELNEKDWPLVQKLTDARLLVSDRDPAGGDTVEIVHEALIQNWERLRAWLGEDRAFRTWQRRLRSALRGWEVSGRDSGALLRGTLLAEAEGWAAQRADDLSPLALAFIATSLGLRDHQLRQAVESDQGALSSAGFSPDGSLVVSAGPDGTARVWHVGTGQFRHILEHTSQVWSAAFSPTGSQIVTGGRDGTASVWEVETGRLLFTLEGHTGTICHAEFSGDASLILTASWDGTARVWDARTGQPRHILEHTGPVYAARFSPDGCQVITISGDKTAKVWDARTGQELHTL